MPAKLKYGEPTQMISIRVPKSRKEEIRELVRHQLAYIPYDKYHTLVIAELKTIGVYTYAEVDFRLDWFRHNEPSHAAELYKMHLVDTIGKEHE